MEIPVNWKMASHPINWITFTLMVVIAAAIGHQLLTLAGIEPSTANSAANNIPAGQTAGATTYADLAGTGNIPAS